jgi:hypothetical protein
MTINFFAVMYAYMVVLWKCGGGWQPVNPTTCEFVGMPSTDGSRILMDGQM